MPDYRQARRPSRVYRGERLCGEATVTVFDSALPQSDGNPRVLSVGPSQHVRQLSSCFDWGSEDAGSLQLAVALLLDVTGDHGTASRWCERFAATYVAKLSADWTVPEVDIAFWLYCYQNSESG